MIMDLFQTSIQSQLLFSSEVTVGQLKQLWVYSVPKTNALLKRVKEDKLNKEANQQTEPDYINLWKSYSDILCKGKAAMYLYLGM